MRILLTGGGTGGHITPLVAVARELKKASREKSLVEPEIFYVGPNGFSKKFLEKEGIKTKIILAGKLRRYFSIKTVLDIFKFPIGIFQSFWNLFIIMPDVIFSKGGYGSVPVILASRLYQIPFLLHESDTIPGISNRFLAKYAKRIAISFSAAEKFFPGGKLALTGNPIRTEIINGSPEQAKKIFNIQSEKPIIFIFGGSQGAQPINEIILSALPQLLEKFELIWQTGIDNYGLTAKEITEKFNQIPASCHVLAFMDENQISSAFAAAALVISRAGAGNIFEIAACNKPSIIIPLPTSASNHQKENAFEYAKSGATVVLEQTNLTPNLFMNEIFRLMNNPELLAKMSECAKAFSKPHAAREIAVELLVLAEKMSE